MKLNGKNTVMHVVRTGSVTELERIMNSFENVIDIYFESVYDYKEKKLMHIAMVYVDVGEEV